MTTQTSVNARGAFAGCQDTARGVRMAPQVIKYDLRPVGRMLTTAESVSLKWFDRMEVSHA